MDALDFILSGKHPRKITVWHKTKAKLSGGFVRALNTTLFTTSDCSPFLFSKPKEITFEVFFFRASVTECGKRNKAEEQQSDQNPRHCRWTFCYSLVSCFRSDWHCLIPAVTYFSLISREQQQVGVSEVRLMFATTFVLFAGANYAARYKPTKTLLTLDRICRLFFYTHNVINPILYYWRMSEFRNEFNKLLLRVFSNKVSPDLSASQTQQSGH